MEDRENVLRTVLNMYGVNVRGNRANCPFCSSNHKDYSMSFVFDKGLFCCGRCKISGRSGYDFYALKEGITWQEAKDILKGDTDFSNVVRKRSLEPQKESVITEEAKIGVKDEVYSQLLDVMPLNDRHKSNLINRGFTDDEIDKLQYKTYPGKKEDTYTEDYFRFPRMIQEKGLNPKGVPGFYKTQNKKAWSLKPSKEAIAVKNVDIHNRKYGIQLRINDELLLEDENGYKPSKYVWLSTQNKEDGAGISPGFHFACDFRYDTEKKLYFPIINGGILTLTEGAMKADLMHCITNKPVMAVPGVNLISERKLSPLAPILKECGCKEIALGYDMDRITNMNVFRALISAKEVIKNCGFEFRNLAWDNEYLLLNGETNTFDLDKDFVFTYESFIKNENIEKDFAELRAGGIKKIFFAIQKEDLKDKEKALKARELSDLCAKKGFAFDVCLWKLTLKGIDDYYAHKKRGVIFE